jgi:hypothetical protein
MSVTVRDEHIRREQYVQALSRWLDCPLEGSRIVLVDNSSEDLERLARSASRAVRGQRLVLISAPHPGAVAERGKGAAEAAMIDYAISRLDGLDADDVLFKVTGRLYVRNVRRVIPIRHGRGQIFVRATLDWSFVDTRFFGASADVWRRHFNDMQDAVDEREGVFLEHVVARRSLNAGWSGAVTVKRFAGRPAFVGYGGTTGGSYADWRSKLRHFASTPLEAFLRHIPPDKQF